MFYATAAFSLASLAFRKRARPVRPQQRSWEECNAEEMPKGPPPATGYVLYTNGDHSYDIYRGSPDEGPIIGSIFQQSGDEEHYAFWSLSLMDDPRVPQLGYAFKTLKDARAWLGGAPVRRYR